MRSFRRVCVYCGSTDEVAPEYLQTARNVGAFLASQHIGVVYGGGAVGLMGQVADGALERGGEVLGVIPERLQALELGHPGLTELFVVDSMHARKTMMAHLSDAFIALPGGWGTLEEIFEVTTWTQLNFHRKPVGILNVHGYYDSLIAFLHHATKEGFIRPVFANLMQYANSPEELLYALRTVELPFTGRWIEKP